MAVINNVYPDLYESTFPESVDNFDRYLDPSIDMLAAIQQYYSYMNTGNIAAANAVLELNPMLKRAVLNAENMNKLRDAIIALERYYFSDVQTYLQNIVVYKDTYSASVKYNKYNVVNYTVDGITLAYMCISDATPIGTVPTNEDYWIAMTMQGEPGESGTGLSPRGPYGSSTLYFADDMVSHNNALWVCVADNTIGQTPSTSSAYWWRLLVIDDSILTYDNTESGLEASTVQDAIDELAARAVEIDIDDHLDSESTNPVENRVVYQAIQDAGGVVIEATAPSNHGKLWVDTSLGGVLKYWNGSTWAAIKSVWG